MLYGARVLLFANSAVNPILYNLTSTKFREAFVKLLSNDRRRQLSRQSTFNTTGTSMSAGRSGSSRTIPTEIHSIRRVDLAHCGRHASLEEYPSARPTMARYGRQSSFAGTYPYPNVGSPYHNHRPTNRTREINPDSPFENRKCVGEERRNSGEGRRLLDNERQVFNQIQEEKSGPKGCLRVNMQRREQEKKIVAEMEKLLTEGEITPVTEVLGCPLGTPLPKVSSLDRTAGDVTLEQGPFSQSICPDQLNTIENGRSDNPDETENEKSNNLQMKEN
ncbi:hypothetical protein SK128_010703, partial [Halocaridina rubra]